MSNLSNTLPSIRDCAPTDFGGVVARAGFAFQDQIAAHFCIRMLSDEALKEVWCETYDDIALIWSTQSGELVEFVQVKSELSESLWSVAMLCNRTKSATNPQGLGTSLVESSLARDVCAEPTRFRLVFGRQTNPDLEPLLLEFGHIERSLKNNKFAQVCKEAGNRIGEFKSLKGNGHEHWLTNAQIWPVTDEAIRAMNHRDLYLALEKLGVYVDSSIVDFIYERILSLVKATAEIPKADKAKKVILRESLLVHLKNWCDPYPEAGTEEKLVKKLQDAGLDETYTKVAPDLRRSYLVSRRTASYLELTTDQLNQVDDAIQSTLLIQLSALDSGLIEDSGVQFHNRCLNLVNNPPGVLADTVSALRPSYGIGCMYEITARCRHRFRRI